MIIDRIEPLALQIGTLSLVLCRVTTKSGLVGYGECLCNRPPLQKALVAMIRDAISPFYLGKSVDDRKTLNLAVRRGTASHGRAGTVLNALAAIDIALWDLRGKAIGRPVYALLGGALRQRVPAYVTGFYYRDGERPDDLVREATMYLEHGYKTIKVKVGGLTPEADAEFRRLLANGALKNYGDGYWFDLRAHYAVENARATRRAVIGVAIGLAIAVIATLFYQG